MTTQAAEDLEQRLARLAQRRATTNGGQAATASSTAPEPSLRSKRNHPAKSARMGALAASFVSTAGLTYLFAGLNASTAATQTVMPSTAATPIAVSTTVAASAGGSGTSTGAVVDTKYGAMQVQATFTDGALTSVVALQSPDNDRKSVNINGRALPTLYSAAVTAQSADVQSVSGATYTVNAYKTSLQAAIDAARADGITTLA